VRETETIYRANMSLSTVVGAADCAGTDGSFVGTTTEETA